MDRRSAGLVPRSGGVSPCADHEGLSLISPRMPLPAAPGARGDRRALAQVPAEPGHEGQLVTGPSAPAALRSARAHSRSWGQDKRNGPVVVLMTSQSWLRVRPSPC